jgi:hypothetical protein
MALKERAGVLEVLFGVGFGGGEARKRFVKLADDSLLFGKWGISEWNGLVRVAIQIANSSRVTLNPLSDSRQIGPMQKLVQIAKVNLPGISDT